MECRMLLSTTTTRHQERHGLLLHYLADITLVSINYVHNEAITVTWNMFSMSWCICLKVGLLVASQCQHSLIRA